MCGGVGRMAESKISGWLGVRGVWREIEVRWTPHPVIVAIRDNMEHIRVLLYSYYTTSTSTGWGVLLR